MWNIPIGRQLNGARKPGGNPCTYRKLRSPIPKVIKLQISLRSTGAFSFMFCNRSAIHVYVNDNKNISVVKFYGRLRFILSIKRASKLSVFPMHLVPFYLDLGHIYDLIVLSSFNLTLIFKHPSVLQLVFLCKTYKCVIYVDKKDTVLGSNSVSSPRGIRIVMLKLTFLY